MISNDGRGNHAMVTRRPTLWGIMVWMLLLAAFFGCLQYLGHAQHVWSAWHAATPDNESSLTQLHAMLAWDIAYLIASFAIVVCCIGAILRQAWARPSLSVAVLLLAAWMVASGAMLAYGWQHSVQSIQALAQPATSVEPLLALIRRRYEMALLLKAVCVVALLILARLLGRPSVRSQFRQRPAKR